MIDIVFFFFFSVKLFYNNIHDFCNEFLNHKVLNILTNFTFSECCKFNMNWVIKESLEEVDT